MTEYSLYGGAVTLDFNEAKHQYRVKGQLCPSVTGILDVIAKPALVPWALKMAGLYLEDEMRLGMVIDEIAKAKLIKEMKQAHRKKSEQAADIGSIVHAFAEKYVLRQNPEMPVNPQAKASVESFLDWLNAHHVAILHAERKIYSRQHFYAGTMDLEAEVDGAFTRLDWKSSNAIYPEYFLQLAGYDLARAEEEGKRAEKRMILRFPKEGGKCQAQEAISPASDDAGFLAALALFRWQKGVEKAA